MGGAKEQLYPVKVTIKSTLQQRHGCSTSTQALPPSHLSSRVLVDKNMSIFELLPFKRVVVVKHRVIHITNVQWEWLFIDDEEETSLIHPPPMMRLLLAPTRRSSTSPTTMSRIIRVGFSLNASRFYLCLMNYVWWNQHSMVLYKVRIWIWGGQLVGCGHGQVRGEPRCLQKNSYAYKDI